MVIVGVGDSHTSAKAELLRAHGCPIPVLADSLFRLRRTLSLQPPSTLLHHLRRTATVIARKKATPDELEARAEASGYQRGAHREEDSRRDGNKQPTTKTSHSKP